MTQARHTSGVEKTRLFDALAYAGVLPFVVGILLQLSGVQIFGVGGRLWFAAYSAVILSFLCGIWWGGALNRVGHRHRLALALLSNSTCLGGWVALMLYRTPWSLPMLALGFAFVVTAEARLNPNLPRLYDYFRTRTRVTYLVIACHLVMIVTILFTG